MKVVFFISIFAIIYNLFIYGIILKFLNFFSETTLTKNIRNFPTITVLCPAYNEEKHIEKKIKSFLALDYPKDRIKMIVISDDSTDNTNNIVKKYEKEHNIKLIIQKPRKGKQSGHNLVEPSITTDYVLSTDADSIFNPSAVNELLKVIEPDEKIGLVSGQLQLLKKNNNDSGEGFYWKYEGWLKKLESKFYSILGANGSIFIIRRNLFTQVHPASVDDFERTLIIMKQGYKAKYNPRALVYEEVTEKAKDEINRKIRIITQEWFCLRRHINIFNPFKYFKITFMFISHKLIKWLFPLFSLLILFSNLFLLKDTFFLLIFIIQLIVYLLGTIGVIVENNDKKLPKFMKIFTYYVSMNYSAFMAIIKFVKGEQFATWTTVRNK